VGRQFGVRGLTLKGRQARPGANQGHKTAGKGSSLGIHTGKFGYIAGNHFKEARGSWTPAFSLIPEARRGRAERGSRYVPLISAKRNPASQIGQHGGRVSA